MPRRKHYSGDIYKDHVPKLKRVMERLGVDDYDYDWSTSKDGAMAWVRFTYKGQPYYFEHSTENTKGTKQELSYVSDVFIQLIYALEDLARIVERNIYDLQTWVKGLKALPEPLPEWAVTMGFEVLPTSKEEVETQYRIQAKTIHPDQGGSSEEFMRLKEARDKAKLYLGG